MSQECEFENAFLVYPFSFAKIRMLSMLVNFQGKVVIIRSEGPKGGPGMPEMLTPTSAIMGAGLGKVFVLLSPSGLPPAAYCFC